MRKVYFPLLLLIVVFLVSGCVTTTKDGEHTGQVTAVEKSGLIWKTGDVYFKSDAQSSQEDKYCVEDNELFDKLSDASRSKNVVQLKYHSELFTAPWRCENNTIIDSFEVVK